MEKKRSKGGGGDSKYKVRPKAQTKMMNIAGFLILANSLNFLTYGDFNSQCVEAFYGVQGHSVGQIFAIVFILMYPLGSILTNLLVQVEGIKGCLNASGFLTVSGLLCRYFSLYAPEGDYARYNAILVAQALLGISLPMSLNPMVKIANNYYGPKQRDWAVHLMYLAHPVGTVTGMLLSEQMTSYQCGTKSSFVLLYAVQIVVAACSWLTSFLFKSKPSSPPSRSNELALQKREKQEEENPLTTCSAMFPSDIGRLLRNPSFWFLMIAFAILSSLNYAVVVSTTETEFARTTGYSNEMVLLFIGFYGIGALFGCTLTALVAHYMGPIPTFKIGFMLMLLVVIPFAAWINYSSTNILYSPVINVIAYFLVGLIVVPLNPACLNVCAEITYDVAEEVGTGCMFSAGSFGFLSAFVSNIYSQPLNMIVVSVLAPVGCIFALLVRGNADSLRRSKVDDDDMYSEDLPISGGKGSYRSMSERTLDDNQRSFTNA